MQKKVLYTALLFVFACGTVSAQHRTHAKPIIIPASGTKVSDSLELDPVNLLDARVEDGILVIQVQYGGGCKDHVFQLFTHPMFFSDSGRSIPVFVSHQANDDNCKAFVTDEVSFPISDLLGKFPNAANPTPFEIRLYGPETSMPLKKRLQIENSR